MKGRVREFQASLRAMEASFHVGLIATFEPDMVCAPAHALAAPWLAEAKEEFDQFPVRHGDATLGLLLRGGDHADKTARQAMHPLSEGLVVSADMPLTQFIPTLREKPYRLVLRGQRIDGLVTQSDLLKLPVRVLVFALITHLEQVMAERIERQWPAGSWLGQLSPGRREKVEQKRASLHDKRMDPALLELTEFGDKVSLCSKLIESSRSAFCRDLHRLRQLRDQLAHAATFIVPAEGPSAVMGFVDQFEKARDWIEELTRLPAPSRE